MTKVAVTVWTILTSVLVSSATGPQERPKLPDFEVVKRQDFSALGQRRMAYRVLLKVDSIPSGPLLCATAKSIRRDGNMGWDRFTVWLYLPDMDTESLAFVTAEFRGERVTMFEVSRGALMFTRWQRAQVDEEATCSWP